MSERAKFDPQLVLTNWGKFFLPSYNGQYIIKALDMKSIFRSRRFTMKKRFLLLIPTIITLILEIIPYGAVCNFARPATDGSIGHFRELYSYFDMTPFGYANFAPLITAIITCVIFLLIAVYCITDKPKWAICARNILVVCTIISLGPLLFGIHFFSIVGALITISLVSEILLINALIKAP